MATVNSVNTTLVGQSGTGAFTGSISPTITTPIISQINDVNGNESVVFPAATNAVNYLNIENQITGLSPALQGKGSDPDVGVNISAQEAGVFVFTTKASNQAIVINTGATLQHGTSLSFPESPVDKIVTFPDESGTLILTDGIQQLADAAALFLGKSTGTESSNAVTINNQSGVITTVSLTTAQYATEVITLTNSLISATSVVIASIMGGTNTTPGVTVSATADVGSSIITLTNTNSTALNGTVIIGFAVF